MATPGGYNPTTPGYPAQPKIRFDAIGEAWNLFTQQMGPWIGAILIAMVLTVVIWLVCSAFILAAILGMARSGGGLLAVLFGYLILFLAVWLVVSYLYAGLFRMALKQVRGQPIAVGDVFSAGDIWLPMVGAGILVGIAVYIGYMIFIIPGLILGGLLMLTLPLVADQRLSPIEAMQQSLNALKPDWLMATLFYFVLSIVAGLGGVLFGIGVIFTLPLFFLGLAIVYRDFFLAQQVPTATVPPMPVVGQPVQPVAPVTPPPTMPVAEQIVQPVESVAPPPVTPVETPPPPVELSPVETTQHLEETTPSPIPQEPSEEPPAE